MSTTDAIREVLAEIRCIRVILEGSAGEEPELRAALYRRLGELRIVGAMLTAAQKNGHQGA